MDDKPSDAPSAGVGPNIKYEKYVDLYTNLDNLVWRNSSILLSVTVLALGIVGTFGLRPDIRIEPLSHSATVGMGFFLIGLFYGLATFTMYRMRWHHRQLERYLKKLEVEGYFQFRVDAPKSGISDARLHICAYAALGLLAFTMAFYHFVFAEDEMAKTWISSEEAASVYGVSAMHQQMHNGELRVRLMANDGNGYIRTVAAKKGSWQNSHHHKRSFETYVVERGWMAVALSGNATGEPIISLFQEGQIYTTKVGEVHNVYLPAGAIIHTVKHGNRNAPSDWHGIKEFDKKTRSLSEEELLNQGGG